MAKTLPRRNEVPEADKWAIEDVFPSEAAFDAAFAAAEAQIPTLARFQGTLAQGGIQLLAALQAVDELRLAVGRIYLYAAMMREGDATDPANVAREDRTGGLLARAGGAAAFYHPEILDIPPDRLAALITEEPGLETYRHFFDQ